MLPVLQIWLWLRGPGAGAGDRSAPGARLGQGTGARDGVRPREAVMRQNTERRTALLDVAIEVLAREGSRGLTLRAVDKEAGVPTGTASNYFAHRGDMLTQVMRRTRERLTTSCVSPTTSTA